MSSDNLSSPVIVTLSLVGGSSVAELQFDRNAVLGSVLAAASDKLGRIIAHLLGADGHVLDLSMPLGEAVIGDDAKFICVVSEAPLFDCSELVVWYDALDLSTFDPRTGLMSSKSVAKAADILVKKLDTAATGYPLYMRFEESPSRPGYDPRWERCCPVLTDVRAPITCFIVMTPTDPFSMGSQWQVTPVSFGGPMPFRDRDVLQLPGKGGAATFTAFQQAVGGGPAIELSSDAWSQRLLLVCHLTDTNPPDLKVISNNDPALESTFTGVDSGPIDLYFGNRLKFYEVLAYSGTLTPLQVDEISSYLQCRWTLSLSRPQDE